MRTLKGRCSVILHGPGEHCHASLHITFFAYFPPFSDGQRPSEKDLW